MLKHKLMFIPTAEGYVSAVYPEGITSGDPPKFAYVTNLRDHLGNLRMSLTRDNGQTVILQERHYYPFGLLHQGYNEEKHEIQYTEAEEDKIFTPQVVAGHYKYLYQEQERQEDLNLNWDSFKYRNYDYAIGRFMSVDPLAEKYPYNGVYNFSENRVIDGRELEGLEVVLINGEGRIGFVLTGAVKTGIYYEIKSKNWGIYFQGSGGGGFYVGASASLGITYFPNAKNISEIKGFGWGMGAGLKGAIGADVNVDYSYSDGNILTGLGAAVGEGGEIGVYGEVSYMKTIESKTLVKKIFSMMSPEDQSAIIGSFEKQKKTAQNKLSKLVGKYADLMKISDPDKKTKKKIQSLEKKIERQSMIINGLDAAINLLNEVKDDEK